MWGKAWWYRFAKLRLSSHRTACVSAASLFQYAYQSVVVRPAHWQECGHHWSRAQDWAATVRNIIMTNSTCLCKERGSR